MKIEDMRPAVIFECTDCLCQSTQAFASVADVPCGKACWSCDARGKVGLAVPKMYRVRHLPNMSDHHAWPPSEKHF